MYMGHIERHKYKFKLNIHLFHVVPVDQLSAETETDREHIQDGQNLCKHKTQQLVGQCRNGICVSDYSLEDSRFNSWLAHSGDFLCRGHSTADRRQDGFPGCVSCYLLFFYLYFVF